MRTIITAGDVEQAMAADAAAHLAEMARRAAPSVDPGAGVLRNLNLSAIPAGLAGLGKEGRALPAPRLAPAQGPPKEPDSYVDRLLKYIPAEIIALYITLESVIRAADAQGSPLYWVIFVFCTLVTPLYLWRVAMVHKWLQIVLTTGAFVVWVIALGGPFALLDWYTPLAGGIILPMYTFLIALVDPGIVPQKPDPTT
jgi:hypothetical protein